MRKLIINLSVLIAGILIATVIAEIFLRAFSLAPASGIATVSEYDFVRVPGLFMPDQELVDKQKPRLPHYVRINTLGYRGRDFPIQKPDQEFRIVMIGDSLTYGDFVDDNETLPAQLEAVLRDICGSVRVINAGVGGTTIVTHGQMANRALQLDPDLVILTFSENDIDDLAAPMWYSLANNRRKKSSYPLSAIYPIVRNTALWNFSLKVRARLLARSPTEQTPGVPGGDARAVGGKYRADYSMMLSALHENLEKHDLSFVFAAYPSHYSVNDADRRDLIEWVAQLAGELQIDFVNLLESLSASGYPVNDLYLLPLDGHPSPLGYTLSAKYMGSELIRKGYIDKACRVH